MVFMSNLDENGSNPLPLSYVMLTNVLCLTFRKNFQILIKMKALDMNSRMIRGLMKLVNKRKTRGRGHSCAAGPHSHVVGAEATHGLTVGTHLPCVCSCTCARPSHASATAMHFNDFSAFFREIPHSFWESTFLESFSCL